MKDNNQTIPSMEMRKNLVTGALAGGMLGVVFGYELGSLWLGVVTGILFGLAVAFRLRRFPAKMRYPMYVTRRMLLFGSLALLAVFGFILLREHGLSQTQMILAALVPLLAIVLFVVSVGTAIVSLDELQRRIQTEAIAIGFAGTAIFCLSYGLLGLAGVPTLNWGLIVPVMTFMWLIGKLWTLWRYR
jgi:hypothetical protein